MSRRQSDRLIHGLSRLVESQTAELTDGQLLQWFAESRDERAFSALLQRHGGLVYHICRNILRHDHDAEDAFQGTFLVLARRAGAIREHKALAGWLYRVAHRIAMKAKRARVRGQAESLQNAKPPEARTSTELAWRELQSLLDEELIRLPEKYRTPFVLCCLLGKSKSEAADELGWKEGTLSSRLAHARELLRSRLARRGVTLTAILSGLAISSSSTWADVPANLATETNRAAIAFATGEPLTAALAAPASYARSMLLGLEVSWRKLAITLLVAAGLVGSAAAVAIRREPPPEPARVQREPPSTSGPAVVAPTPVRGSMRVIGSVVDRDGKRIPGAQVTIAVAEYPRAGESQLAHRNMRVLAKGQVDRNGDYEIHSPQSTDEQYRLTAFATAPGFAFGGAMVDPATVTRNEHLLPVVLERGRDVRVRLVEASGQPARRVKVHLLGVARQGVASVLVLHYSPPVPLAGWPVDLETDDAGFVTLPDLAPQTRVDFQVRDPRYAIEWFHFETAVGEQQPPVTFTLQSSRTLRCRVIAEDTRLPSAHAIVFVESRQMGSPSGYLETKCDADGRVDLQVFRCESLIVTVFPAPDQPYLESRQELKWPDESTEMEAELTVPRGLLIRGVVLEAGNGRPVAGATVNHQWADSNHPHAKELQDRQLPGRAVRTEDVLTRPDGTFSIAVPPGPGTLLIKSSGSDFVLEEASSNRMRFGKPAGGMSFFANAVVPISGERGSTLQLPPVRLRMGSTRRGRVLTSRDVPATSAFLITPGYVPDGLVFKGNTIPVQSGTFEIPGCDPGRPRPVWIYDAATSEGAVAELPAGSETEPIVRLLPCVSAYLRVLEPGGKPMTIQYASTHLVVRPGDSSNDSLQRGTQIELLAPTSRLGRQHEPELIGGGTVRLSRLIPGATYHVNVTPVKGYWPVRKTFTAPLTGELDLGDFSPPPRK